MGNGGWSGGRLGSGINAGDGRGRGGGGERNWHLLVGELVGSDGCLGKLPELGDKQATEEGLGGLATEAGLGEQGLPGGNAADAEAREKAKGGIKSGDESAGDESAETAAGGNLKFRDEPERAGSEVRAEAGDEGGGFRFGQAIEEEVGDDEVVAVGGRVEAAGVGAGGGEPMARADAGGSVGEQAEHGGAEVDGVGVEIRMAGEKTGEEAAVAIAQDERLAGWGERGQVMEAAAFEKGSEGEIFPRPVDAGDVIEPR